jgi:U3 small nucleolar RNA-associated protein 4
MFLDFVGEDEMVVVERPWFGILESLPPSFYRKSYGEG